MSPCDPQKFLIYYFRDLKGSKTRPSGRVLASKSLVLTAYRRAPGGHGLGQWGVCSGNPRRELEQNKGFPGFWSFPGTPGTCGTRQNPHRAQSRLSLPFQKDIAPQFAALRTAFLEGPRPGGTTSWLGQKGRKQGLRQLSAWHHQAVLFLKSVRCPWSLPCQRACQVFSWTTVQ